MLLLQHPIARDVLALTFAPGGRTLFAGVNGGFAVWDLDTGECSLTPIRHSTRYWGFATDPLGRGLHVAADGYQFYPPPYREFRRLAGVLAHDDFRGDNHVTSLALSWDGSRLAVSRGILAVNRLERWDIGADGQMNLAWSRPANPGVMFANVALHPACTYLTASDRGWTSSGPLHLLAGDGGADLGVFADTGGDRDMRPTFTPDGRYLLIGGELEVSVWDYTTRSRLGTAPRYGQSKFSGLAIHPSSAFFATSAGDRCVRYWSLPDCRPRAVLKWDIGKLHSVALSREGMLGAAGGQKGQVVVWDVEADGR